MLRGTDGPIRVAPAAAGRHPVARAFAEALATEGAPVTDDLSGRVQQGVAWPDLAIADGERVSPADGYLRPVLGRANLVVVTDCRGDAAERQARPVHWRQLRSRRRGRRVL